MASMFPIQILPVYNFSDNSRRIKELVPAQPVEEEPQERVRIDPLSYPVSPDPRNPLDNSIFTDSVGDGCLCLNHEAGY